MFCIGQKDTSKYNSLIGINLTELVIDNIRISIDQNLFKNNNLILEAAYQPGLLCYSNGVIAGFDEINIYTYKGYNFSIGYELNLKQRLSNKQNSLSLISTYGHKFRNNFLDISGGDGLWEYDLTDATQDYKECKFIFGRKNYYNLSEKHKRFLNYFEWYTGIGIIQRKATRTVTAGGCAYDIYHKVSKVHLTYLQTPFVYNYDFIRPELCLGVKWGFAF